MAAGSTADTPLPADGPQTRRMRIALGTFVELCVAGSEPDANETVDMAFGEILRLHSLLSFQDPDSELSRLNGAQGHWVKVSAPTATVLKMARALTRASGRRFDCTVGGELVRLGMLPDHLGTSCLGRGSPDDIEISRRRARLRRPLRLTLDGIAKGFAVDHAVLTMQRRGVRYGWVNAGGDLRVFGDCQLPVAQRHRDGSVRSLGLLRDAALATSHVGGPPDPDRPGTIVGGSPDIPPQTVSVLARTAWRADALTKVAALAPGAHRADAVAVLGGQLVQPSAGCSRPSRRPQ